MYFFHAIITIILSTISCMPHFLIDTKKISINVQMLKEPATLRIVLLAHICGDTILLIKKI